MINTLEAEIQELDAELTAENVHLHLDDDGKQSVFCSGELVQCGF